ncbi:hypothetical protein BY458DRAFT_531040 [Sporodiniella umbellata]|nr:hypothetical protein BY458DRAFT_531040 [Sporodiniella umbellata]
MFKWFFKTCTIFTIKKSALLFRNTPTKSFSPKRSKITSKNIFALLARIVYQANLVFLKQHLTAYNMLKQTLDVELPNLPRFLWLPLQSTDIVAHDVTLVKIVQFALANFCSKWHRYVCYQPKYEHTHWIDRFVPILQFATDKHIEFVIHPDSLIRTTPVKYHDGIDCRMNEYSRLIMKELSRNMAKENTNCTQGNVFKALHSICVVLSFSFQCVCTTITVFSIKMKYTNIDGYVQNKAWYADVPNIFNNCVSSEEAFKFVADLFASLQEQKVMTQVTNCVLHILNEISGRPFL